MQCVTQQLNDTFKVKDLGKLKYFLGFEVTQSGNGIHVSQRKYILDVLEDIWLLAIKSRSTFMVKKELLCKT